MKRILLRSVFFIKFFFPVFILYGFYFSLMEFYLFPSGSPKVARARASHDHARLYSSREVEFLILGDSTALYGLIPKKLSADSVSFSMIASTLYSAHRTLREAGEIKIKKGIILTQTFISDHYNESVWGLFVPSGIFSPEDVMALFCGQTGNACSLLSKTGLVLKYIFAKGYLTSFSLQLLLERVENYDRTYAHLYKNFFEVTKKTRGFFEKTGIGVNTPQAFLSPFRQHFSRPVRKIPPSEIDHLKKIQLMAHRKKIPLYFVIMPFAASKRYPAENYRESVKKVLRGSGLSELKIIDLSVYEKRLSESDFWDYSHLNAAGAEKTTQFLKEELIQ